MSNGKQNQNLTVDDPQATTAPGLADVQRHLTTSRNDRKNIRNVCSCSCRSGIKIENKQTSSCLKFTWQGNEVSWFRWRDVNAVWPHTGTFRLALRGLSGEGVT